MYRKTTHFVLMKVGEDYQPFEILDIEDLSQLSFPSFVTKQAFNHSSSAWMNYRRLKRNSPEFLECN